jgi:hypothetical protein
MEGAIDRRYDIYRSWDDIGSEYSLKSPDENGNRLWWCVWCNYDFNGIQEYFARWCNSNQVFDMGVTYEYEFDGKKFYMKFEFNDDEILKKHSEWWRDK